METILEKIITNVVALAGAQYIMLSVLKQVSPNDPAFVNSLDIQDVLMTVSVCNIIQTSAIESLLHTCGLSLNDLPDFSSIMDADQEETNKIADGFVDDLVELSLSRLSIDKSCSPTIH